LGGELFDLFSCPDKEIIFVDIQAFHQLSPSPRLHLYPACYSL
jgi:hypothetical protein